MAKRSKEIRIVVHIPVNGTEICSGSQFDEFWINKIVNKLQDYEGTDIDILIDKIRANK
ncbi:hypothetical protein [Clostridium sp. AF19-22AC]|jgi:hypothetical protein|uniref:hypothetical protein n=1 Tax=Clostridium sp. AF19-22AC TaxID=2292204 RepID=UPI001652AFF7|nr:hypothetical protein [Clostridium sp. AF19-22AC]